MHPLRAALRRCPQQYAALVRLLKAHGAGGMVNPYGRKVYVTCKRQGKDVRVVLDRLPSQQQRW